MTLCAYDTEAVTRELVRALRGERSQEAVRRRLRYGSNVVYHWESGRRYPTVAGLLWLAHRTGVDLVERLRAFGLNLPEGHRDPWTVEGAAELFQLLQGHRPANDLADALGVSRHKVGRWIRGDAEPRFPDFLQMVEFWTARSTDLLTELCDPQQLPAMATIWERRDRARRRLLTHPWSAAVQLALELEAYKALDTHQPGWIAERLQIPEADEQECLDLLEEAGDIARSHGRFVPTHIPRLNLGGAEERLAIRRFWGQVASDRLHSGPTCSGGWNLFTVTEEEFAQIKRLQRDYFRSIRSIVQDSERGDHIVLATMQVQLLTPAASPPED